MTPHGTPQNTRHTSKKFEVSPIVHSKDTAHLLEGTQRWKDGRIMIVGKEIKVDDRITAKTGNGETK